MTLCYEISIEQTKISLTYNLAPVKEPPSPYPKEWWNWIQGMEYSHDGCFGPITRKELAKHWVRINPIIEELPDTIGMPYPNRILPLIVNGALKKAIEAKDPNTCDFVKVARIWDRRFQRDLSEREYYFMAIRSEVDTWDREKSRISEIKRNDGTSFFTINTPRVIRSSAVGGNLLWRDALTGTVLCSEPFKVLAEQIGCRGLAFRELDQSST